MCDYGFTEQGLFIDSQNKCQWFRGVMRLMVAIIASAGHTFDFEIKSTRLLNIGFLLQVCRWNEHEHE